MMVAGDEDRLLFVLEAERIVRGVGLVIVLGRVSTAGVAKAGLEIDAVLWRELLFETDVIACFDKITVRPIEAFGAVQLFHSKAGVAKVAVLSCSLAPVTMAEILR